MELAPLALLAGVLSITSPCCLPLIPGYLSYVSGVTGDTPNRNRVMVAALLFVLGFTFIFTALGATASLLGGFLFRSLPVLLKAAGVFVIIMGLTMLGWLRIPWLMSEKRIDLRRVRAGPAGAFPLGMAFAVGWTPCLGPILSAILAAAGATQTVGTGAALLAIYSLGMGIPFMLMAFAYARAGTAFKALKRYALSIERAGGVLLVAMGVLLITGYWQRLFGPLLNFLQEAGWPPIQ